MSYSSDCHSSSSRKNFTLIEKRIFLQILGSFKHIIESRKSNITAIKEKEMAWREIHKRYNKSTLISQEMEHNFCTQDILKDDITLITYIKVKVTGTGLPNRTIQQLKKCLTNIKHNKKEVIKKERLFHTRTGRPKANVDSNVTLTTPYPIKTAPVLFTSNMTEKESSDKRDFVSRLISTNDNIELLSDENDNDENDLTNIKNNIEPNASQDMSTIQDIAEECNKEPTDIDADMEFYSSSSDESKTPCITRRKRKIAKSNVKENMQVERIKRIIQQEQQLANIMSNHETKMAAMKEEHLKEFNYLQLKHLKEIHEEELKIKEAELKSIEYQRQQKGSIGCLRRSSRIEHVDFHQ